MQPGHSLTRQQLQRLAVEASDLADWTAVRDFALQMYGSQAATVQISIYSEFSEETDEGISIYIGTFIEEIGVCDKDGNDLAFDHSLPFFQSDAWLRSVGEDDMERYKAVSLTDEEQQCNAWMLFDELPAEDATYDLSVIPALSLPTLA